MMGMTAQETHTLLLPEDLQALPRAIRTRFAPQDAKAATKAAAKSRSYHGTMSTIEYSKAGKLFAQFCCLLGHPLPLSTGHNIRAEVSVFETPDGTTWRRRYRRGTAAWETVQSTKVVLGPRTLMEKITPHFAMLLHVHVEDAALHFVSTRYCLLLRGRALTIPALLTPGQTRVIHKDEGNGLFRFTLTMDHPILGRTTFQEGLFKEVE